VKRPTMVEEAEFASIDEAAKHYEADGFRVFDQDSNWMLLQKHPLEAYIRTSKRGTVSGSVIQLQE
jgi:hypothetical protein